MVQNDLFNHLHLIGLGILTEGQATVGALQRSMFDHTRKSLQTQFCRHPQYERATTHQQNCVSILCTIFEVAMLQIVQAQLMN